MNDRERDNFPEESDAPDPTQGVTLEITGDPLALFKALAGAVAKMTKIVNSTPGQMGHRTFKYAPLEDLVEASRPALSEAECCVLQFMHGPLPTGKHRLTTVLSGHGCAIYSHMDYTRASDLKEWGKQTTYLRRYAYRALFQLDGSDDADSGDSKADQRPPEPRREQKPPPVRPRPEPSDSPRARAFAEAAAAAPPEPRKPPSEPPPAVVETTAEPAPEPPTPAELMAPAATKKSQPISPETHARLKRLWPQLGYRDRATAGARVREVIGDTRTELDEDEARAVISSLESEATLKGIQLGGQP